MFKPNGCGPYPLNAIIPNFKFKKSCDLHDKLYAKGIGSRKQADLKFYKSMLKKSKRKYEYVVAYIYYITVRSLGWIWWHGKKLNLRSKANAARNNKKGY